MVEDHINTTLKTYCVVLSIIFIVGAVGSFKIVVFSLLTL